MTFQPAFPNAIGLDELVRKLGAQPPDRVPIQFASLDFIKLHCWYNAQAQVLRSGEGKVVHGWAFWNIDVGILAQHHAVWERADGLLIDITAHDAGLSEISFARSPNHQFDYDELKGWLSIRRRQNGLFEVVDGQGKALPQSLGKTILSPPAEQLAILRSLVPTVGQKRYPL